MKYACASGMRETLENRVQPADDSVFEQAANGLHHRKDECVCRYQNGQSRVIKTSLINLKGQLRHNGGAVFYTIS